MNLKLTTTLLAGLGLSTHAYGVLIYNGPSGSPTAIRQFVSDAPATPPPAGTGGALVGQFGLFSGTPISPTHFITAKHFIVSPTFTIGGTTYTVGSYVDDLMTDLRIVSITGGTFSSYANLYSASDEVGKQSYVFGRGRPAGSLVSVSGTPKGWKTSDGAGLDGKLSWGTETISATNGSGTELHFNFSTASNGVSLTEGDSGGGMFIQQGGVWKLAGVHYSILGPFDYNSGFANYFSAAIFDVSGLYFYLFPPDYPAGVYTGTGPGYSSSTRISNRISWINTVIPEPASIGVLALILGGLLRRRR